MKQLLIFLLLSVSAFGQKVFIQNDSGYASVYDNARPEIAKHLKLVDSRSDADLIFLFTRRLVDSGLSTNGQLHPDGSYSSDSSVQHRAIIQLDVLDRKTGDKLWTNSREWAAWYPQPNVVSFFHKIKPPSGKLVQDYVKQR